MTGSEKQPVHPYACAAYADAFLPDYEPLYLPYSRISILKRTIPGTLYYDALGCYPLSPLFDIGGLEKDWQWLKKENLVSLVLVADPFFCPLEHALKACFDHVLLYKEHYMHDFGIPHAYGRHHRYEVKRAYKAVEIKTLALTDHIEDWIKL